MGITGKQEMGQPTASTPAARRSVRYRQDFAEQVYNYTLLGATDTQLGLFFGVTTRQIMRWRDRYPEFRIACKRGKHEADGQVAAALFKRAVGYSVETQKAVVVDGKPGVITVVEHVHPDVQAARFWLTNRQPQIWQDVRKHDISVTPGKPELTQDLDIRALIAQRLNMLKARYVETDPSSPSMAKSLALLTQDPDSESQH